MLFGSRVTDTTAQTIVARYRALLAAIVGEAYALGDVARIPHREINLFLIPAKSKTIDVRRTNELLSNFSATVSNQMMLLANRGLLARPEMLALLDRPGPFLLTTYKPMRDLKAGSPLLIYDLSSTPPSLFPDLVKAYMKRVEGGRPNEQEVFTPGLARQTVVVALGVVESVSAVLTRLTDLQQRPGRFHIAR